MFRKLLVSTMAMGLVAGLVFGSDSLSYFRTVCRNVRETVKSEISPEFELDRIRGEVDGLMPEIRRHMTIVAEQVVDVKDMERETGEKDASLASQKQAILALRSDLDSGKNQFTYQAVSYTRGQVENDLSQRFDAFRMLEESLRRDQKILVALRDTLAANQQKLDAMMLRKKDLVVKVAQLEARLKQVQAAETINAIEVDDTKLARVENLIRQLNRNLDVRQSVLETEGHVLGRIPVGEPAAAANASILSRIDSHFGISAEKSSTDEAVPSI